MEKLTALIAAPYTPMHPDGSVNPGIVPDMADHLQKEGVAGVFICGTTGEGASLTVDERMLLAEQWVAHAGGKLPVIVHAGHNSVYEARRLAKHAQSIRAHGIAALAPSFFKPDSLDGLVEYCAAVAEAAPALPFFYYHIPSMTGVNLSMPEFLRVGGKRIPTLSGVKFSASDLMQFHRCTAMESGRYTMLFGSDEMLLGALAMGAEGAVGSTYNYAAPNYVWMMEAFKQGDMETARRFSDNAVALVEVLLKYGVIRAGKSIMAMRGIDCGEVRLPLTPLSANRKQSLYEEVRALAIFENVDLERPS